MNYLEENKIKYIDEYYDDQEIKGSEIKVIRVDYDTGEVFNMPGYTGVPKKLLDNAEKAKEFKARSSAQRSCAGECGRFVFAVMNNAGLFLEGLSPANATRLCALSTYQEQTGLISRGFVGEPACSKDDIADILKIGKTTFYNFWSEAYNKYIFDGDNNDYYIGNPVSNKTGKFTRKHGVVYSKYRVLTFGSLPRGWFYKMNKIYKSQFRSLYTRSTPADHKKIGHIIHMLPYLNQNWNAMCRDTTVEDVRNIDYLQQSDFCKLAGINFAHSSSLLSSLSDLTFEYKNKDEQFISTIKSGHENIIVVNKKIIYSGLLPISLSLADSYK